MALKERNASYMYEIDGVRGIALTLVVVFHLFGNGRVSGGVDVFLVISAYFLTRKLLSHFGESGPPSAIREESRWISAHFQRVLTRLLPSAILVLATVLIANCLLAPLRQQGQTLLEVFASAFYFENWELISSQLAYEAAGPSTSPLQHFWSLSVQGQFFLTWPLLAWVLYTVTRRSGMQFSRAFFPLVVTLTAGSFVWALYLVTVDQPVAYFNTFTRFWELGVGALIAFIPTGWLAHKAVKESLVWVGLTMIVSSGFIFDGGALFPGFATLWPVFGTAAVLFGASRSCDAGFSARALATQPVPFLAKISYQLYLWHWPVLIYYLQTRQYDAIGWRGAATVLAISLVLAITTERLTTAFTNSRVQADRAWVLAAISVFLIVAVGVVALSFGNAHRSAQELAIIEASQLSPDHIGARALTNPELAEQISQKVQPLPALDAAYQDRASIYYAGCVQGPLDGPGLEEVLVCDEDNFGSERTVVLTGGSHAVQWYPALKRIAEAEHWRLLVIEKNGCRLGTDSELVTCREWNKNAVEVISSYSPDLVFTLGTQSEAGVLEGANETTIGVWEQFMSRGIDVMAIRDNPRVDYSFPECVQQHEGDLQPCSISRDMAFDPKIDSAFTGLPEKFSFLDLTDAICGPELCEPIVGNVTVYRDKSHMTATYVSTLTPALETAMRNAMPSLFR